MVSNRKHTISGRSLATFSIILCLLFSAFIGPFGKVYATEQMETLTPSKQPSVIDLTNEFPAEELFLAQTLASLIGTKYDHDVVLIISNFGGDQAQLDAELEKVIYSGTYGSGPVNATTVLILDNFNYLKAQTVGNFTPNDVSNPNYPPSTDEIIAIIDDINANYNYLQGREIVRQSLYSLDYILAKRTGSSIYPNPLIPAEALAQQNETLALIKAAQITVPSIDFTTIDISKALETTVAAPTEPLPSGNNTSAFIAETISGGPAFLDPDNLLPPDVQEALSFRAMEVGHDFDFDLVLALLATNTGQSSKTNAENLYSNGNYGPDGVLALIDIVNKSIWITTNGRMVEALPSSSLADIATTVADLNDIDNGEYEGAMTTLLSSLKEKLRAGPPLTTTSEAPTPSPLPRDLLPKRNNTSANILNTPTGGPALLDYENILSAGQQEALSAKAIEVGKKYGVDVVLVIMTTKTGQSAMANADDLFDYGNYGPDGVLGLIDIANRTVWISTTGKAIEMIPNAKLDKMAQRVVDKNSLAKEEYAGAMNTLMAEIEDKLADTRPRLKAIDLAIAFGVALVVFLIFFGITNSVYRQPKGAKRKIDMGTQAIANYDDIQDILVDTRVTSSVISSSSGGGGGGGGGGGSHTGSSGVSHGGGGASW